MRIFKSLFFIAFLAVAMIVGTGVAQADLSTSYTGSFSGEPGSDLTTPLGSISLSQFNPSLGTLNSVTIALTSDFNYLTTLTNTQPSTGKPATGTFTIYQQLQINALGQTMLDTGTADPNNYPTGYTYKTTLSNIAPGITGTDNATNVKPTSNTLTISGAALAAYIGSGNLGFNIYSTASEYESISGGNYRSSGTTKFDATATVTYNFTPVPIPAAVWLFGSGLLGIIGLRRKFS
jgi:hypothetical protein